MIAAAVCFIYAEPIVRWFRDDADVIAVGKVALRYQCIVLPLMGISVSTNMMLQSIGKGVKASITSAARNGIFFIPLILILPHLFGIFGVEITQACADVLALLLTIPLAISELQSMKEDVEVTNNS